MPRRGALLCGRPRRLVRSRRVRLFLLVCLGTLVLCGAFTAVFLVASVRRFDIQKVIDDAAGDNDGIALIGHAYNIDVFSRAVQMSWLVVGCGSFALPNTKSYQSQKCGSPNVAVDLYFDGSDNVTGSYDPDSSLWFTKDTNSSFYIQSTVEIQTQHLLEVTAWYGQDQQYAYPFDYYTLDTYFQALSPKTNTTLPTVFVRVIDATSNFQPHLRRDAQLQSRPAADGSTNVAHGVQYYFYRVPLSQLFVMVLFVVNWLLTAVVVYISVSAWEGLPMSEGVLILPLSVILTIPALRALWVDAPAFGLLLDSCGTFLQFVIVAISSVYLVVRVGLRRQQDAQAELAEMQETIAAAKLADLERDAEGLLEKGPRTSSPPRLGPIHFPEREDTFV